MNNKFKHNIYNFNKYDAIFIFTISVQNKKRDEIDMSTIQFLRVFSENKFSDTLLKINNELIESISDNDEIICSKLMYITKFKFATKKIYPNNVQSLSKKIKKIAKIDPNIFFNMISLSNIELISVLTVSVSFSKRLFITIDTKFCSRKDLGDIIKLQCDNTKKNCYSINSNRRVFMCSTLVIIEKCRISFFEFGETEKTNLEQLFTMIESIKS
jgi:hypothetical protein